MNMMECDTTQGLFAVRVCFLQPTARGNFFQYNLYFEQMFYLTDVPQFSMS